MRVRSKGEERRIGGIANGGEEDKRKCRYYSTVASSVIIVIIYQGRGSEPRSGVEPYGPTDNRALQKKTLRYIRVSQS